MDSREFFNVVSVMMANMKSYKMLQSKKTAGEQLTQTEQMDMYKYMRNFQEYAQIVGNECDRVNEIIKQKKL